MSELEIVEVRGGRGGAKAWNTEELEKIINKAKEDIKKNGFAIVEREAMEKCYNGASVKWLNAKIRRKLNEYFDKNSYDISFYESVKIKNKKTNEVKELKNVYIIKPKK